MAKASKHFWGHPGMTDGASKLLDLFCEKLAEELIAQGIADPPLSEARTAARELVKAGFIKFTCEELANGEFGNFRWQLVHENHQPKGRPS
jgi:hypothetical protein